MNRLFVHNPIFRLLSPLLSGVIVYGLILMIYNNVGQLIDQFLGEELYICIALSYLIQEFSRLSLILFAKLNVPKQEWLRLLIQISSSIIICILIVSIVMFTYYEQVLGFTPNMSELTVFYTIFSTVSIMYISLYLSHQFLYQVNEKKMAKELALKEDIQLEYQQFTQGINPQLLFESLESLIVNMARDAEEAQQLLNHLSIVYRYVLSDKFQELVPVEQEIRITHELTKLFSHLPYRKIELEIQRKPEGWIVPGTLLFILEQIIRSTIIAPDLALKIYIADHESSIQVSYEAHERLSRTFQQADLAPIVRTYSVYSDQAVSLHSSDQIKIISLPKLIL